MKEYTKEEKVILVNLINEQEKAIYKLKKELDRNPSNEEIAEYLNKSIDKVIDIQNIKKELDKEFEKYQFEKNKDYFYDYTSSDTINKSNKEKYEELRKLIKDNNKLLNDKDKEILYLRFNIEKDKNYTINEIANIYNISRKDVRRHLVKGLNTVSNSDKVEKRKESRQKISNDINGVD